MTSLFKGMTLYVLYWQTKYILSVQLTQPTIGFTRYSYSVVLSRSVAAGCSLLHSH